MDPVAVYSVADLETMDSWLPRPPESKGADTMITWRYCLHYKGYTALHTTGRRHWTKNQTGIWTEVVPYWVKDKERTCYDWLPLCKLTVPVLAREPVM